ncbi:protein G12-like [Aedes albopictus]|uniref:Secreted protein n=1 Tax=Aedes albopictus TaxID=7160 RepID=A0ABM1ZJZ9_AEDAL
MKAFFILTALVAVATASFISAPVPTRSLKDDLQDFVNLLPVDKLTDLVVRYFTTDKEFQEAFAYLQGQEFAAVWDQFFALKEVKDVLNYLEGAGLEVYDLLNQVADFLGVSHVKPTRGVRSLKAGGLSGFVDEALALLPLKELKALYEKKLKTSPEFKAFFDKLFNADFQKLVDFYQNSKEAQAMVQKLREHGVDVDKFFELVAGFFGWGF